MFAEQIRRLVLLPALFVWGCSSDEGNFVAQHDGQSAEGPTSADHKGAVTDSHSETPQKKTPGRAGKKKHTNRLARETSPYLLLHAHNPVDWFPWGPEAFAKAGKEQKPIFVSIGYSSCYWCHVMERLVFENEQIAAYMNEHFVNIKVDREERPDIDDIYMTALNIYFQAIGSQQGGGWPLSMFLTSEGRPFMGGTYFPPKDANGQVGFDTVLRKVNDLWKNRRQNVVQDAEAITTLVRNLMKPQLVLNPVKIDRGLTDQVIRAIAQSYDSEYGGISFNRNNPNGPKFPSPANLALLQYAADRQENQQAAKILNHTLDQIAAGGIRDHLGGGFHRYSTDRFWLVPHFEKMLYDQAQLADVYVEAFRQTGKPQYREVVEGIFEFTRREMTDAEGGFYSALDAETDGIEGQFYVWSKESIEKLLDKDDADLFKLVYGLEDPQAFEHGYVLHLPKPIPDVAGTLNVSEQDLQQRLTAMRQTLLAARSKRKSLLRDDKILTGWNGLMIRAYAHAGMVFGAKEHVAAAEKAATFVLSTMRDDQQRLLRTYRGGQAKLNAYVDDYAFLVEGLLTLYEATDDEKWLNAARRLTDQQIEQFWDKTGKGFFFTPHHHEVLIVRTKNANDSAIPAGNSVSVRNLIRLASLTGEKQYRQYAQQTLQAFVPAAETSPGGKAIVALAVGEFLDETDFKAAPKKPQQPKTSSTPGRQFVPVAGKPDEKKSQNRKYLTTRAYLSLDKLPAGETCRMVVVVDIQEGWHINTNPAKPDNLVATKLGVTSKFGCKLTSVQYPVGKTLMIPGAPPQSVYEKQVVIRGLLKVPADAAGQTDQIEIEVRYQACNESVCLAPQTVKLAVRVPIARPGEPVRPINQELFLPPKQKTK